MRVAVVTGASRGIGRHIADAFAANGYAVERGSSKVAALDDPDALGAWFADILERRGRVDVLVNNAGVIDAEVDIFESDPDDWWQVHEVNVRGTYVLTRLVGRSMLATGGGRIININSGRGMRAYAHRSAYPASKAAIARITGAVHLAGWDRGIRAFDVLPGVVRTDMAMSLEINANRTEWTEPRQVTELVLALASGDLDAFSGRIVDAFVDTPGLLREQARSALGPDDRTLCLLHTRAVAQRGDS